jgi:hypothetical protein
VTRDGYMATRQRLLRIPVATRDAHPLSAELKGPCQLPPVSTDMGHTSIYTVLLLPY